MRISSILAALAASMAIQATATPVPDPAPQATDTPVLDELTATGIEPKTRAFDCESNWLNPVWTWRLASKCPRKTADGEETIAWTEINLNECLTNEDGQLQWKPHGLALHSCWDCTLSNQHSTSPLLSCHCNVGKDKSRITSISLRDGLYNKDGILHCFDYSGIDTTPKKPTA